MRTAVIAGAGIAGLATALRLGRDGWRTLVVERAPGRRSSGHLVNLLGPAYDAAEHLGLAPALSGHSLGFFTTALVHADGSPKFTVPSAVAEAAVGPRALTVFRGDLETVLFEAVRDHTEIRFGTTITSIDQDTVTLSDGTTRHADLVVGADGVHSATRAAVFGAGFRRDFPYVVSAVNLTRPVDGVPESSATMFIGPGRTAAIMNLGPDRSSAFFTYRCPDPAAARDLGPAASLSTAFGDLGGGVPTVLGQLGDAYFDSVSQIVMPRWSTGTTVLLGDAAWCVTLFAGHGAGLALAGADRLGAALQDHPGDIPAALASWEATLRPEVRKRQSLARRGMLQYAPPTRFHIWLNEMTMRAITLPVISTAVRRSIARATH